MQVHKMCQAKVVGLSNEIKVTEDSLPMKLKL